jgi:hypothetical protein
MTLKAPRHHDELGLGRTARPFLECMRTAINLAKATSLLFLLTQAHNESDDVVPVTTL